jgi:putative tricarboxylic transport membrane protein
MTVDRILGVGAILTAIPVAAAAWGFGVGSPKSPGAGFWPLLIVATMGGLGVWLIVHPSRDGVAAAAPESRWGRLWIALGTMVFYVAALDRLGFPLATVLLLLVQLRWVEGRPWRSSVGIAVLATLLSFVLFRVLLKVPLPAGVIPLPRGW